MGRSLYKVEFKSGKKTETRFVENRVMVIGRSEDADFMLPHQGVSRKHIVITHEHDQIFIEDQGTSNGTKIGSMSIKAHSPTLYRAGEPIQLGTCPDEIRVSLFQSEMDANEIAQNIFLKAQNKSEHLLQTAENEVQKLKAAATSEIDEMIKKTEAELSKRENALEVMLHEEKEQKTKDLTKQLSQHRAEALEKIESEVEVFKKESLQKLERQLREYFENQKSSQQLALEQEVALEKARHVKELSEQRSQLQEQMQVERLKAQQGSESELNSWIESQKAQYQLELSLSRQEIKNQIEISLKSAKSESENLLTQARSQIENETLESESRLEEAKKKLHSVQSEINSLQPQLVVLKSDHSDLKLKVETLNLTHQDLMASTERLQRLSHELENSMRSYESQTKEYKEMILNLSEEKQTLSENTLELTKTQFELNSSLSTIRQELKEAQQLHLKAKESALQEHSEAKIRLEEERNKDHQKARLDLAKEIYELRTEIRSKLKAKEDDQLQKVEQLWSEKIRRAEVDYQAKCDTLEAQVSQVLSQRTDQWISHLRASLPDLMNSSSPDLEWLKVKKFFEDQVQQQLLTTPQKLSSKSVKARWLSAAFAMLVVVIVAFQFIPETFWPQRQMASIKPQFVMYTPVTTPELKESYTKNLIYTTNYFDVVTSDEFQSEWIKSANRFFIKDLGLSDNSIIEFIAKEKALIEGLQEKRLQLSESRLQTQLPEMVKFEEDYSTQLMVILEGERRYKKFQDFSRKFYDSYVQGRPEVGQEQSVPDSINETGEKIN